MSPRRARALIEAAELPEDEARSVILCDVRRMTCVAAARELGLSVDGLAKLRRRAYIKLADEMRESST